MGMEARLFLGPRDGEVIGVVEAVKRIVIMADPIRPDTSEYTEYVYERVDEPVKPGVYNYNYVAQAAESETDDEGPQD